MWLLAMQPAQKRYAQKILATALYISLPNQLVNELVEYPGVGFSF